MHIDTDSNSNDNTERAVYYITVYVVRSTAQHDNQIVFDVRFNGGGGVSSIGGGGGGGPQIVDYVFKVKTERTRKSRANASNEQEK